MLMLAATAMSFAQAPTPESCLARVRTKVAELLAKNQPPLFAWHLKSIRVLVESEYGKLSLGVAEAPNRDSALREKEFVDYSGTIATGLETDCANPDDYLKNGRRGLVLARPSQTDGSLQYMMVGLPKGWDPNRAYPLYVGLHGSGPDNTLAYPSFGFGRLSPQAGPARADGDMIHLNPWGRGNRGWRDDAERDLFEALAQLQTFAKVDHDRWYLTGHSSGADGCWAILQHTPDLWASAGIQSGSMLSGPPDWGLIPNMTYVPVHFLIGANDNLPYRIPDMKEANRILLAAGDDSKLVILEGIGHYPLSEAGLDEQTEWITKYVRKRPAKFHFTIDKANHPGVWGIQAMFDGGPIRRYIPQPWPSFDCEIAGSVVTITAKGIKQMSIDLGSSGLRMDGSVRVLVNGKQVFEGPVPSNPIKVDVPQV